MLRLKSNAVTGFYTPPYRSPWYLRDGGIQTIWTTFRYGGAWQRWGDGVPWLTGLPTIPWQESIFTGADGVPLWGCWSCPPRAKGTLIINYGITGTVPQCWYAQTVARKAYSRGWAVCLYDWRSHGRTAELSPVPSSDGWREGSDQVQIAQQLVQWGCPPWVGLIGFSLGGQIALWGLKAAVLEDCDLIQTAAVLAPNLESDRSLAYLMTTPLGRYIEWGLTLELRKEAQARRDRFPEAVPPGAVAKIDSIRGFDREMVIAYYGFNSVEDYYRHTSGLYLLPHLRRPYLLIYGADDPMFDPTLVPEIQSATAQNPQAHLLLTPQGGHVSHISKRTTQEDEFWGFNRLVDFCDFQNSSKSQ